MALENEQELIEAMADLRRSMGSATADFNNFDKSTKSATAGLKAFGKAATKISADATKGMASFAAAAANGDTSLRSMNKVIDVASQALSSMASAIPLFGNAVAGVTKAVAEGAKFVVDQLDQTAKVFNELGEVGALTAKGMTGVRESFLKSGLTLQGFQKQVVANSETLAQFRGLTGQGAEDFAAVVGDLTQGTDDSLRRLGLNADQIGTSAAAFVKQQTALGRAQNMTRDQLVKGTIEYTKELDILTKVTGQSREAIQKQQDAALSETRFRAVYEEEMARGNEKGAKAMMAFQTVLSGLDKEAGQGLRDLSSGVASTDAAQKLMRSTGGAAADIIERLKTNQIDQAQAQIELKQAFAGNIETMRSHGRFADTANQTYIQLAGSYKIMRAQFDKNGNVIKEATAEQEGQISAQDALTEDTIKAQKAIEGLGIEVNKLAFGAMPVAAKATAELAESMKKFAAWINEKLGTTAPGPAAGAGGGMPLAETGGGAAVGARLNMGRRRGAAAAGGGTQPPVPATGGGPPTVDPYSFIEFGGNTGSREHFNKLQPDIQQAFLAMAQDYNNLTGKKLRVNSAFRSPEEQANVNSGTNPKAAPGMSLHQHGRAIDINSDQVLALGATGLLNQYGFKTLPGDPPHIFAQSGFSGTLSGPSGGYRPNVVMHGTEDIKITPSANNSVANSNSDLGIMTRQLEQLETIARTMKEQLGVNQKMLQYAS